MSFTRKHYEETARIVRDQKDEIEQMRGKVNADYVVGQKVGVDSIQAQLSAMFASDNPRFDAERFAKACEPKGAK